MRPSTWLGTLSLIMAIGIALTILDAQYRIQGHNQKNLHRKSFQRMVGLTDLSITTAARYLRHYTLTDMTTPYQDYPASLDHFPAGFAFAAPDYSNMPTPVKFGKLKLRPQK